MATENIRPEPAEVPVPRGAIGPLHDEIDFRAVFGALWRRKLLLSAIVVVATGIAAFYVSRLTPLYSAESQVMIETRGARVVELGEVVPTLTAEATVINTQIEILHSRSLASQVIERLALHEDPEINPALRPAKSGTFARFNPFRFLTAQASSSEAPAPRAEVTETEAERRRTSIVGNFLQRLDVEGIPETYVIAIKFVSEDAQKAALIANTLADRYIENQVQAKFEATRQATVWLEHRLGELRQRVIEAATAVENYREQAGLIEGRGGLISDQQLADFNSQMVAARADRSRAEVQYRQLKLLVDKPGAIEAAPEVLGSAQVQNLRAQETALLRRIAELSTRYRGHHPVMINAQADLRDLRQSMAIEIDKVIGLLANQVEIAQARERALGESLKELSKRKAESNRAEVRLRALERELDASQTLYQTFLARFKQTSEQQALTPPDAQIISHAVASLEPSSPNVKLTVVLALFGSALVGVLIVMLLDKLNTSFLSRQQVEEQAGVRVLGLVPASPESASALAPPPEAAGAHFATARGARLPARLRDRLTKGRSGGLDPHFVEAVRSLGAALSLPNGGNPPKVLLVTSSVPEEGKTVLAAALARQVGRWGKRCLLVDGDLRRPGLHAPAAGSTGLVDVLLGTASIDEAVIRDHAPGLDLVAAGAVGAAALTPRDAADVVDRLPALLGSDAMKDFLGEATARYDLVVIDSPPLLTVSDARILSCYVDKTIFVVRWGKTRRDVALANLAQLADVGVRIAGIVLTRVNRRKYAKYGFSDSGQFSDAYRDRYRGSGQVAGASTRP